MVRYCRAVGGCPRIAFRSHVNSDADRNPRLARRCRQRPAGARGADSGWRPWPRLREAFPRQLHTDRRCVTTGLVYASVMKAQSLKGRGSTAAGAPVGRSRAGTRVFRANDRRRLQPSGSFVSAPIEREAPPATGTSMHATRVCGSLSADAACSRVESHVKLRFERRAVVAGRLFRARGHAW